MKFRLITYFALVSGFLFAGCEKDNYEPPSSVFEGRVVYNDEPIGVQSGQVEMQLWQHGYDLFVPIPVMIDQDGSFSAILFDGDYKLVFRSNDGPWVNSTDSIDVQVRGNTVMDVEVTPYYTIEAEEYTRTGDVVRGYFNVTEVAGDREIEDVTLYFGQTMILDKDFNAASTRMSGSQVSLTEPNILAINVGADAELAGRDYVFARASVKISGVEDRIYTPVVKIILNEATE